MNDLIELHQNEIENLKQGIADMEEKIQYQSEERLRDVYEMLESCQTRVRPPDILTHYTPAFRLSFLPFQNKESICREQTR